MNSKTPKSLYRYISNFKHLEELLKKKLLHYSSPKSFNDPFDFMPSLKGFPKFEREMKKEKSITRKGQMNHNERLNVVDNLRQNYRVCCFTELWNSYLMWSYYANGFKGYCIGFDFNKLHQKHLCLEKIQYSEVRKGYDDFVSAESSSEKLVLILPRFKNTMLLSCAIIY